MKRLSRYMQASWPWKIPIVKDKGSARGQGMLSALPSSREVMGSASDWQKDWGEYGHVANPHLESSDSVEEDFASSPQHCNGLRPVWIRPKIQLPLLHSIKHCYYCLINLLAIHNSPRNSSILGKRQSLPKITPSLATLWLELRCFCSKIPSWDL